MACECNKTPTHEFLELRTTNCVFATKGKEGIKICFGNCNLKLCLVFATCVLWINGMIINGLIIGMIL